MDKKLKEKIKAAGKLLAGSMLDESVKKVILKNASHLREIDIDVLIDALMKERMALLELQIRADSSFLPYRVRFDDQGAGRFRNNF